MNNLALRLALVLSAAIAAGVIVSAVAIFLGSLVRLGLAQLMTPGAAAAIVSLGGLAVASGLVFGGIYLLRRVSPLRARGQIPGESRLAKEVESFVGAEFVSLIQSHPRAGAAAALLAGFAVGARPDLRKTFRQLL